MLFNGVNFHSLDAKNRIFIPAKYRDPPGEGGSYRRMFFEGLRYKSFLWWFTPLSKFDRILTIVGGGHHEVHFRKCVQKEANR